MDDNRVPGDGLEHRTDSDGSWWVRLPSWPVSIVPLDPACKSRRRSSGSAAAGALPVSERPLRPGHRLLFHTDGVTDLESPAGERYQLSRLTAELGRRAALPPPELLAGVVEDLESFGGGGDPRDDQTLLLVAMD